MQVFAFHLMPWPYLPDDFAATHDTAWVVCENSLYDPPKGHEVYNRYLDELEFADQLGFDGICLNEHHQNAYGLMPSPNIMAACLARRTSRARSSADKPVCGPCRSRPNFWPNCRRGPWPTECAGR